MSFYNGFPVEPEVVNANLSYSSSSFRKALSLSASTGEHTSWVFKWKHGYGYRSKFTIFDGMIDMNELLALSKEEKLKLIEQLWDSLNAEKNSVSSAHETEILKRRERVLSGESHLISFSDVKKRLDARRRGNL